MKKMTVSQLATVVRGQLVVDAGNAQTPIDGYYAGDFLSNVMTYAGIGSAWFTVMTNVNVIGAANMAGVKCVVVCEGKTPDPLLIDRARDAEINVITTSLPVYDACVTTV